MDTRIARGSFQRQVVRYLETYGEVPAHAGRLIRGRAHQWGVRYQNSLDSVLERYTAVSGRRLRYIPGPRGGRWLARYVVEPV